MSETYDAGMAPIGSTYTEADPSKLILVGVFKEFFSNKTSSRHVSIQYSASLILCSLGIL